MTHSDGYHFIQLGKHLERSEKTARILDVKYATLGSLEEGSTVQTIQLSAMLRSCSAMEAYRKTAHALQAARVSDVIADDKRLLAQVQNSPSASVSCTSGIEFSNAPAWPNAAVVCSLSQVLERGSIPRRFFLSSKACAGILRRAEKRGKTLPPMLHQALTSVAATGTA